MAIWDPGANRFSKDIQQVCMTESSGGDPGQSSNKTQNVNVQNKWQNKTSGTSLSGINSSISSSEQEKVSNEKIAYIKYRVNMIIYSLEQAKDVLANIRVNQPFSFVRDEIRKCLNCCYSIIGENKRYDILKNSYYGGGGVRLSNEEFVIGVAFIETAEEIFNECKSLINEVISSAEKQRIYTELFLLSNNFGLLIAKINIHREYLIQHNNYYEYVNSSLNDNKVDNVNLSTFTTNDDSSLSSYLFFEDEIKLIDKSLLLEKQQSGEYLTDNDKWNLLLYELNEIQKQLTLYSQDKDKCFELVVKSYQLQINYYEEKVSVSERKELGDKLTEGEQKLVDLYTALAAYIHSQETQYKNFDLVEQYRYDTRDYYHNMINYYMNDLYVDLDVYSTLYTPIPITYGQNGSNLSAFIYDKYEKQLEIELAYYVFMKKTKELQSTLDSLDPGSRDYAEKYYKTYVSFYSSLVEQLLDRIKSTMSESEQEVFAASYQQLTDILHAWRVLWAAAKYTKLSTLPDNFIEVLEAKKTLGMATAEELELLTKDREYIRNNITVTKLLSFGEGVGSVIEGFLDMSAVLTVVLFGQGNSLVLDSTFDMVETNYSNQIYNNVVDKLGVDKYISTSVCHDVGYSMGFNSSMFLIGALTYKAPLIVATISSGTSMQQMLDNGVNRELAISASLVTFVVNSLAAISIDNNIKLVKNVSTLDEIYNIAIKNTALEGLSQIAESTINYMALSTMEDNLRYDSFVDYLGYMLEKAPYIVIASAASGSAVVFSSKAYQEILEIPNDINKMYTKKINSIYDDICDQYKYLDDAFEKSCSEYLDAYDISFESMTPRQQLDFALDPPVSSSYKAYAYSVAYKEWTVDMVDLLCTSIALSSTFTNIDTTHLYEFNALALDSLDNLLEGKITLSEYIVEANNKRKSYDYINNGKYLPAADSYLTDEFICTYVKSLFPSNHAIQSMPNLTGVANRLSYGYSMNFVTFQSASSMSKNIATTGSFGSGAIQTGGMYAVPKWYLEEYAKSNPNICSFTNGVFEIHDYEKFSEEFCGGEPLSEDIGVYMIETQVPINGNNLGVPSSYNVNNSSVNNLFYLEADENGNLILDENGNFSKPVVSVAPFSVEADLITNTVYTNQETGIQYCVSHIGGN